MFSKIVLNSDVGNKMLKMKWWLWDFSQTGRELLLADDPLLFLGDIDHPNLVIALPISPTKAFLTTQSDFIAEGMRITDPKQLAERLNAQSLLNARVRIYARNAWPRRFISNRLRFAPTKIISPGKGHLVARDDHCCEARRVAVDGEERRGSLSTTFRESA